MTNENPDLIQVDENDHEIGTISKQMAHREGILHRAFSVFIFDSKDKWLLQKRAMHKYHSPGLWSNTCCGHPNKGEDIFEAAKQRLKVEMGMAADIKPLFNFTYRAELKNGLVEHEFDHVFIGATDSKPIINPDEVSEFRYVSTETLREEIKNNPENFTEWFKMVIDQVVHMRLNDKR